MVKNQNNMTWLQIYKFEAVVHATRNKLFIKYMIEFFNQLELNNNRY